MSPSSLTFRLRRLPRLLWLLCVLPWTAAADDGVCRQFDYVQEPDRSAEDDERLIIDADDVSLDRDGLSQLQGGVTLRQGGREFSAESIDYDEPSGEITVKSESVFRNPDLIVQSREARFDLNRETGNFFDAEFTLPTRAARGSSKRIQLAADRTAELEGTVYTTCEPSSDAWYVEAQNIHLDQERGIGTARNARLRFQGVPVLYAPYFQFPIDDQRHTGMLFPTIGQSDRTGFDFSWPLYLNLAPNYDATLTPRYMSDRGTQIGADFRYLIPRGEGAAGVEHLDQDRRFGASRTLLRFDQRGLLNRRLAYQNTYTETSDEDYFVDLGGNSETSSITHLERSARLVYQSPGAYRVQAMAQNWQPITSRLSGIDDPYTRAPQVRLDALTRNNFHGTRAGINGEWVNFVRDDSVEGLRSDVSPYLLFQRDETAWYFTGQGDLRYTSYELTGTPASQSENPDRFLPVMSAEGGLRFERVTRSGRLQTLEPRGFALYVPYEDQDELPLFDTGEPDFDFIQLLARNRFSGADRVSDARHVAGSLTTRLLDPATGLTRWSASVGQLFRFTAPRVETAEDPAPERGATEFIGQMDYRFSAKWLSLLAGQWSPKQDRFERGSVSLLYRDPLQGQRFDVSYRYRRDLLEQSDVSFSWPIGGNWRLAARSRYSIRESNSLDHLAGLEYETCCWALRASYRRYILSNSGDYNSGVYLQLELKGLSRIGTGYTGLLPFYGEGELDAERY